MVYKIINGIYDHKVVTGLFELSDANKGTQQEIKKAKL